MTRRDPIGKSLLKAGLSETRYGYLLRDPSLAYERTRAYEIAMACAGTLVAVAVVGIYLLPALRGADAVGAMQLATAIILLSLAALLLRNSSRGRYHDTEVDFEEGELRVVRRNTRGRAHIETRVPFAEVRSIFVRRSKARNGISKLCIRVVGSDSDFELVAGSEEAMSTLHRRLVRDINTERGKTQAQHAALRAREDMLGLAAAGED